MPNLEVQLAHGRVKSLVATAREFGLLNQAEAIFHEIYGGTYINGWVIDELRFRREKDTDSPEKTAFDTKTLLLVEALSKIVLDKLALIHDGAAELNRQRAQT
jgi:hypothetical protein